MEFPGPTLDDLIITPDASVLDAMRAIDRNSFEVALVCQGRTLVGLVTDGDIRHSLVNGGSLERPVMEVASREYTAVGPEVSREEALRIMVERRFKCIPVVDGERRLLDLYTLHASLREQQRDTWAVIMAGGRGERLGELTQAIPKPMLPVGGRPLLEHIVGHLASHGIRRIFISINYLGRMIEDYFGDGRRFFCQIEYLREEEALGTGGPLRLLPERPQQPLLVMNGDLLTRIHLGRLLAFHAQGGYAATLALREHVLQVPFGVAEVEGSRLTALVEKPTHRHHINAGIYVIAPRLLQDLPPGPVPMTELIRAWLSAGEAVGGYFMHEQWADMGLPSAFLSS